MKTGINQPVISHLLITFIGLYMFTCPLKSQFISAHHEPDLDWQSLTTPHFLIHYPANYEELGSTVGIICEEIYESVTQSLNFYPDRTHVIIHTRTDIPGGVVSFLPWRIELRVSEPQGNTFGSGDQWLRLLIIHEFTHIVHLQKHKGLSTLTYPLFGDFNTFWHQISPEWFSEGFATLNETRYTSGGRGRTPYFWMQMAAPAQAEKPWRLKNTNYYSRKRIPSAYMRYISGYYLTHFIQRQYGSDVWASILDRYAAFPLFGFGRAVKSVTDKSLKELYTDMLKEFNNPRTEEENFNKPTTVWKKKKRAEDQLSPRWVDKDHLVFYRRSLDDLEELVEVGRDGTQKQILQRKLAKQDNGFSTGKNIIVWAELYPHIRFTATIYSDLNLLDLQTGNITSLTDKKRIYSPDLSSDETDVVAIQTALPTTRLVTVNLENVKIDTLLEIPGSTILNPRWSPDKRFIAFALKDSTDQQNIAVLEVQSKQWFYLYEPNLYHDNNPCWTPDSKFILYTSDQSGIFNLWSIELTTRKRWMITDSNLGAFTPDVSPDGSELAFSIYTHTGFSVVTIPFDSTYWFEEDSIQFTTHTAIIKEIDTTYSKSTLTSSHKPTKTYRPWSQILRPQGWLPYLFQNEEQFALGVSAISQDVLRRHYWSGNFSLFPYKADPSLYFRYTYRRFWPEFTLQTYKLPYQERIQNGTIWRRKEGVNFLISLPLLLENNIYETLFRPTFYLKYESVFQSSDKSNPNYKNYRGMGFGFYFSRRGQAPRDIIPHKAWYISTHIDRPIPSLGSEFRGFQIRSQVQLIYPALFEHHQIELLTKYQNRRGNFNYDFFYALPTGYLDDQMQQQLRYRLAYIFPLAYLELPIGFLPIFMDYIDCTLFHDVGTSWNKVNKNREVFDTIRSSSGIQVSTVNYIFQRIRIRMGTAIYYHSKDNKWKTTLIFQFNLS